MPPALTQRGDGSSESNGNGRLAPPFVAPLAATDSGDLMPWETPPEGVVEPVFEADTDAALEELSQQATREEFPLDAFIVPEQTKRMPAGLEGKAVPVHHEPKQLIALATRLEKLSHRLRVEETAVMLRELAKGDRLDAMLAGLIAGYLAGTGEQD